jgi:hypothetical protein
VTSSWTGWWTLVLILGCAEDSVCEKAADKLEGCKVGDAIAAQGYARVPLTVSREDCSEINECVARCVAAASCADIRSVVVGPSTDPNEPPAQGAGKLFGCVAACVLEEGAGGASPSGGEGGGNAIEIPSLSGVSHAGNGEQPCRAPIHCCAHCDAGKACGDTCIDESDTCQTDPGCACNIEQECPE